MSNFIYINKNEELLSKLSEDEFLIYCQGAFASKRNEELIFSASMMDYYLNSTTRKGKLKIRTAIKGLIEKELISFLADDVYLIKETKKGNPYFVLYNSEFEKLKHDSKLLRYFCFILSRLNNKTHQWHISYSIIEKEFGITNKTAKAYNNKLVELGLINIISSKVDSNRNKTNIFQRLTINIDNESNKEVRKETIDSDTEQLKLIQGNISKNKSNTNSKSKCLEHESEVRIAFADAVQINPDVFTIYKNRMEIAEKVGIENFIAVIKKYAPELKNIFISDKYKSNTTQHNVNIAMNIICKDLEDKVYKVNMEKKKAVEEDNSNDLFFDERNLEAMQSREASRISTTNPVVKKCLPDFLNDEIYSF